MKKYFKNKKQNTINYLLFIVFFIVLINAFLLFNTFGKNMTTNIDIMINEKIDKVLYQFFSELINDKVVNNKNISNILLINKNRDGEIITVDYDIEKTYKNLTNISKILRKGITDLENGTIDVLTYDKYLQSGHNGLILYIPFFLNNKNIFLNNLGPRIPVLINFNETLLTNIKTKVTNYGFNNALLEVYITVEMKKLLITPYKKIDDIFKYEILIGAVVINGRVPAFYGDYLETNKTILDIPTE